MTERGSLKKCSDIELFLSERMQLIRKTNGYLTDLGEKIMRGKRKVDADVLPVGVLLTGEDVPIGADHSLDLVIEQDFVLGAYLPCDPNQPNDAAHEAIKDLKRAVFGEGLGTTLGGRVKKCLYQGKDIGPRVDGEPVVFAIIHITVHFAENLLDA